MKNKTILLTGCGGFIASAISKKILSDKYAKKIISIDNFSTGYESNILDGVINYRGDCFDKKLIDKVFDDNEINEVLHFAGQSSGEISFDDPSYDLNTNTLSTLMLLKKSSEKGINRFMYASTMSVYGDAEDAHEDINPIPKSFYGVSKIASEKYLDIYSKIYGMDVISLRLFNVYGPGQNLNNLRQGMVSIFIAQLLKSNVLNVHGDLNRYRDFIYIDDVVDLVIGLLQFNKFPTNVLNIGTGKKTTVKEIIDLIAKNMNIEDIVIKQPTNTPGDIYGIYANTIKLKNIFPNYQFAELSKGISAMISAYDK